MQTWFNAALMIAGTLARLLIAEAGYRVWLWQDGAFAPTFKVAPAPHGVFDRAHGVRFEPDNRFTQFNVTNGRVTWCPDAVFISNADGLDGRTTLAEYNQADLRILVFGDSFTHWNRNGQTWPDLMQQRLAEDLQTSVAVLNYARGGYGILQMFDLAEAMIREHRPTLAVVAFITGDLTRDRWWKKNLVIDDYLRPLRSPSPDDFGLDVALDHYLVNASVTHDWCHERLADGDRDGTLRQVMAQYRDIRGSFFRVRGLTVKGPFALDGSYLLNHIRYGAPLGPRLFTDIPRLAYKDYALDSTFVERVARIRETGIPVMLVHLPIERELTKGPDFWRAIRNLALMDSLQRITGEDVVYLFDAAEPRWRQQPINLLPHDVHPTLAGLELYADLVTPEVSARLSALAVANDGSPESADSALVTEPIRSAADQPNRKNSPR